MLNEQTQYHNAIIEIITYGTSPRMHDAEWTWAASLCLCCIERTLPSWHGGYRIRSLGIEETACYLGFTPANRTHNAVLEVGRTSPPCSRHSWYSTDGTEDPVPIDDTRSSYHWNTNLSITPPCRCKRDSVMNSTSSKAMCLTKSFSSVMSVFLSSTWDDLGSNHNSPISWREYVMEHCEFKGTDSVWNAYR